MQTIPKDRSDHARSFLLRLFCQSRWPSFFHCFSMPFWVDLGSGFPPNLPSKNDQKPRKSMRQDAIHLGIRFFIDFWSVLAFNLDPLAPNPSVFHLENYYFLKTRLSKITSISASSLVPTCLHVGLQNGRSFDFGGFQEAFKI